MKILIALVSLLIVEVGAGCFVVCDQTTLLSRSIDNLRRNVDERQEFIGSMISKAIKCINEQDKKFESMHETLIEHGDRLMRQGVQINQLRRVSKSLQEDLEAVKTSINATILTPGPQPASESVQQPTNIDDGPPNLPSGEKAE